MKRAREEEGAGEVEGAGGRVVHKVAAGPATRAAQALLYAARGPRAGREPVRCLAKASGPRRPAPQHLPVPPEAGWRRVPRFAPRGRAALLGQAVREARVPGAYIRLPTEQAATTCSSMDALGVPGRGPGASAETMLRGRVTGRRLLHRGRTLWVCGAASQRCCGATAHTEQKVSRAPVSAMHLHAMHVCAPCTCGRRARTRHALTRHARRADLAFRDAACAMRTASHAACLPCPYTCA
eukprot:364260-Chlamydomonas_euryale.AAC.12